MTIQFVVCYCIRDGHILLGKKKKRFGVGKWNGYGGRIEAGESIEEATRRELLEETGGRMTVGSLTHHGSFIATFLTDNPWGGSDDRTEIFFLSTIDAVGEPIETDEMEPCWFPLTAIPYDNMLSTDREILGFVLAGKKFKGEAVYRNRTDIEHFRFEEVP